MSQDYYRVTTVKWTGRAHTHAFPKGAGGKTRAEELWNSVSRSDNSICAYFFIDGFLTRQVHHPKIMPGGQYGRQVD